MSRLFMVLTTFSLLSLTTVAWGDGVKGGTQDCAQRVQEAGNVYYETLVDQCSLSHGEAQCVVEEMSGKPLSAVAGALVTCTSIFPKN